MLGLPVDMKHLHEEHFAVVYTEMSLHVIEIPVLSQAEEWNERNCPKLAPGTISEVKATGWTKTTGRII